MAILAPGRGPTPHPNLSAAPRPLRGDARNARHRTLADRPHPSRSPSLRRTLLALALFLAAGLLGLWGTRPSGDAAGVPPSGAQLSLLAVGDTGEPPGWLGLDPQRRVGRA